MIIMALFKDRKIKKRLKRGDNSFAGEDLRGINLSNCDLQGIDFSEANLSKADLRGASLKKANLKSAKLVKAMIEDVNFKEADLTQADLSLVSAQAADFRDTKLVAAKLIKGNFVGADFSRSDLSQAYLTLADFRGTELAEVNFTSSEVTKTNFKGVSGLTTEDNVILKERGALLSVRYVKKICSYLWPNRLAQSLVILFFLGSAFGLYLYAKDPHHLVSRSLFERAVVSEKAGNIDQALATYAIIMERLDLRDKLLALVKAAELYRNQNNLQKSTELFSRAIQEITIKRIDDHQISILEIEISENILREKGAQAAITYLEQRKKDYVGGGYISEKIGLRIAELKVKIMGSAAGEQYYQQVITEPIDSAYLEDGDIYLKKKALFSLAVLYLEQKNFDLFEEWCLKGIEIFKQEKIGIENLRGVIKHLLELYIAKGENLARVQLLMEKIMQSYNWDNASLARLKLELGYVYQYSGQTEAAYSVFRELSQNDDRQALVALAMLEKTRERYVEAAEHFKRALALLDKNSQEYFYDELLVTYAGELAQVYVKLEKIHLAIELLKEVADTVKFKVEPLIALGKLYLTLQKLEKAKTVFQQLIKDYQHHPDAYLELVRIELNSRNYQEAEKLCDFAIGITKEQDKLALFLQEKINIYQERGEKNKQLKILKDCVKRFESAPEQVVYFYLALGRFYLTEKNIEAAQNSFQVVIDKYKDHFLANEAFMGLIEIAKSQGDEKKVEALYTQAMSVARDKTLLAWLLQERALWYLEKGEVEKAKLLMVENLKRFKDDPQTICNIYFDLAGIYTRQGNQEAAENIYKDLIANYPDNLIISEVYIALASIEKGKQNYVECLRLYEQAIALAKGKGQLLWALREQAALHIENGEQAKAISLYLDKIKKYQDDVQLINDIYFDLAELYRQDGKFKQAEEIWLDLIARSSGALRLGEAYLGLGLLEKERKNYELAEKYFNSALDRIKENSQAFEAFWGKVQTYVLRQNILRAIDLLQKNINRFADDEGYTISLYLELGRLYFKVGNKQEAKKVFNYILENYKGNSLAEEAKADLQKCS